MAKGKVVCIYGAKGGIGKTSFAINMAGASSKQGKKTLIIDLDLCNGAIAFSLNKVPNKTIFNFCDDFNNNRYESIDEYTTKYNDHIDFLACPKDPRQANKINTKYIDILIDKCVFLYDLIIIDTNSTLHEANVFALDKCNEILFLTTNDAASIKNLRNILNVLQDNEIKKYHIVLNNSINPSKKYLTMFDIKNILNSNIDYVISEKFYNKNYDILTFNGEILTLKDPKLPDNKIYDLIINNLLNKEANHE